MTDITTRLRKLWKLTNEEPQPTPPPKEPFVKFPCGECNLEITLDNPVMPGDAVVVDCPSCGTSMTVYCQHLYIYKTKELPEGIGKKVWAQLSV